MTTKINNEHKKLNVPNKQEQNQTCLDSAEREGLRPKGNVPNLRFPEFQGEWISKTIGDIAPLQRGFDLPTGKICNGKIPVVYSNGIMNHHSSYKCVAPGLVTGRSGTIGKFTYIEDGYYWPHNTSLWVTDFHDNNPKFIHYLYQTIHIEQYSTGSGVPTLNRNNVHRHKTFIPKLKEQNKIAAFLSLLDERIATQNKIIDKLQSLIKGINQREFMNSGINYKLGEICEIRNGYSGSQLLSKKGLKVSRIETISGHKVNMEQVGYVAPFESSEKYRLQVGDILFSNINSVEYIGNTAFIDKDYDLYHGMNLLRLTPNNMVVIPFYLYLLLNTNRMLNHFKTVCNKAVSQASINQTELGKTVIQIPPIKTQKQICELYQALYTKLETASHTKSLFQNQKQYLLRQMFI